MKLNADNLEIGTTRADELRLDLKVLEYLRGSGYPIDGIKEPRVVSSNSTTTGHLVAKVKTYEYPRKDPRLDIADDGLWLPVCDCWAFRSQEWPDMRDDYGPGDVGRCKHIRKAYRAEDAKEDDDQAQL